jgi:hypothetical protein
MFLKSLTAIYTAKNSNFFAFNAIYRMVLFLDATRYSRRRNEVKAT